MKASVAIAATASVCALGNDDREIDEALAAGTVAVGPIEGFDASAFGNAEAAQIWAEGEGVEDDPALRILGPHGRLLEHVVRAARRRAPLRGVARERLGLYVGMGMVDAALADLVPAAAAARAADGSLDLARFFRSSYRMIHPLWPLSMLNNVPVGQMATDLDIRGDNLVLASDAVSGVRALIEAARAIRDGIVDAAIAAGVSERVCPASLARRRLEAVDEAPGEGGAALILCRADGAPGPRLLSGDTRFGPDAADRAVAHALEDAGRGPADLDLAYVPADWTPPPGCEAERLDPSRQIGDLGAGAAAFFLARAVARLAPGQTALIVLLGCAGGAGALVVEQGA